VLKAKERAMSQKLNTAIAVTGIDLGKKIECGGDRAH
jgi:hypothetical protein